MQGYRGARRWQGVAQMAHGVPNGARKEKDKL